MKRGFYTIMAAQFFSSLADNALLIASIALLNSMKSQDWMTPLLKLFFVLSYVLAWGALPWDSFWAFSPLLSALIDERARFPFTVDYDDTSKIDFEHFQDYYSEARLNAYFDEVTRLNARLVARAEEILSPDQVARFEDLLRDQTLKSKYVVKTTHALIGKPAAEAR